MIIDLAVMLKTVSDREELFISSLISIELLCSCVTDKTFMRFYLTI